MVSKLLILMFKLKEEFMRKISQNDRVMIETAFKSLQILELTEWFMNYDPPEDRGYMWDTNETKNKIVTKIAQDYPGHSGCSLAITMRTLKGIIIKV